jgi:hypothetical protein
MTYTPTTAEIDRIREQGQDAARRTDGSPNDCPYRLLGSDDKQRTLVLARLWLISFDDARAWMREQS